MKKILFMSFLLMFTLLQQVTAQNRNISGRVTDRQSGEGLPGVTVLLKGTSNGVSTNSDGTYTLSVPSAGGTLVFSSIGYIQTERAIGSEDQLNIGLAVDSKQLSEVVVTGYGVAQERRDVTGSIASVKGAEIAQLATPSFDQQLGGRAAGVQVTVPTGILGQAPVIRIRGFNSITSGASPLIVVDGTPVITGNQSGVTQNNPLGDINPSDIESYEVLKDGASTAIYGSRAANGVILITTKKGKSGKPQVSYETWIGQAETFRRYKVLNAADFITISNEKYRQAGDSNPIAAPFNDGSGRTADTDWQDVIFRKGFQQNHNISLGGGTDRSHFYFSLGYTNQNGVVRNNSLKRYTFRANLDQQVTDWLKIGADLGVTRSQNDGLNTGRNSLSGNVLNATSLFPNVPVQNLDGSYYITPDGKSIGQGNNRVPIDFNYTNIGFVLANNIQRAVNYRSLGNAYAEATIMNGLRFTSRIGTDIYFLDDFLYYDPRHGDGQGVKGRTSQSFSPVTRWNWQNLINFDRTFSDAHKIGVVLGSEYQQTKNSYYQAQVTQLSDPFFGQDNIISGTFTTPTVDGDFSQNGFDSYFGRINYSFKDRYLAGFTARNDGLSSLPAGQRRGTFLGGSLGWRVSEESFFKGLSALSFISDLKFRGSYAEVGNVDFGDFPYLGAYGAAQYGSQNGSSYTRAGNNNLKWETSKKTDLGVDLGFLENRITTTIDLYRNNNDGQILQEPTALSLGVPNNYIARNVGNIVNEGIELGINSQNVVTEDFNWSTNFNLAFNRNEVKALSTGGDIISNYNIVRVGESIGSIYGYDFVGVNTENGNPIYRKGNGTLIQGDVSRPTVASAYYVYDPNNKGDLSKPAILSATDDKIILGNSVPTYFGGISNTFTYKGFDLNFLIRFSGGNKIMNVTRQNLLRQDFVNNGTEILDRWTTPGQVTDVPKLKAGTSDFVNLNNSAVSRFVEKGDFIRGQSAVLGYTLKSDWTRAIKLSRVRVYVQGQNLFIITKYTGIDPEAAANATGNRTQQNTQFGVDFNGNPQQRVYTAGLNVSF